MQNSNQNNSEKSNKNTKKREEYHNQNWVNNSDISANNDLYSSKYKQFNSPLNSSAKINYPIPIHHLSDKTLNLKSSYQAFKSSYVNLDVNQEKQNILKLDGLSGINLSDKKESKRRLFSDEYFEDKNYNQHHTTNLNMNESKKNKMKNSTKPTTENVSIISDNTSNLSNIGDISKFMRNKKEILSDQTLKLSKFHEKYENEFIKSGLKSSSPMKKKSKILNLNPEEVENLYISNNIKPIMTLNLNDIKKKPIKPFHEGVNNTDVISKNQEILKSIKIPNKTMNDFKISLETDSIKQRHKSVTDTIYLDNLKFEREILCKTIVNPSLKNNNHINNPNANLFTIEEESRKPNNILSDNKLNFKTQYNNFNFQNNYRKYTPNHSKINNESSIKEEKYKNSLVSKKTESMGSFDDEEEEKEFDITGKYNMNIYSNKNSLIAKEYAYFQDINKLFKDRMEDVSKTIEGVFKNFKYGIFSIYDGHGGSDVAIFCKNAFINNFKKHFDSINSSIIKLNQYEQSKDLEKNLIDEIKVFIKNSFLATDSQCKVRLGNDCGSTATIAIILKFHIKMPKLKNQRDCDESEDSDYEYENVFRRFLFVSNIGDSSCYLLGKKGECRKVSIDHKCSDLEESRRVKSCGGSIVYNRVMGELMVTRAYGDNKLKLFGVTAEPYTYFQNLSDNDNWLILASDGIWDGVNSYDLMSNSKHVTSSEDLARFLTRLSVTRGSKDNISVICIRL